MCVKIRSPPLKKTQINDDYLNNYRTVIMRKLQTTQREISTQQFGQVVQFPQRQTAWTSKKASQKTLGLPVWAVLSICSVGFGIGFVGISFLLSKKEDYHPIKDTAVPAVM